MEQYIIGIILLVLIVSVGVMEHSDRKKIPDLPTCSYISNYCTEYGKKQNIKYIIKEPTNKESIKSLLSKIEIDCCRASRTVYWRMSLLISLLIIIFIWLYNYLDGNKIKATGYLFIMIIIWFLNYWMRNYLDYHYHSHMCKRVKESVDQLRSQINNIKK